MQPNTVCLAAPGSCGILVSRPGIEPGPSAVKEQSHNNWITRESPVQPNREPRNKLMHLWSVNLCKRMQEYTIEKRQFLQQVVLGKLDSCTSINEVRTLPHTIHKNKLKMAQRPKYKT